MLEAEGPWTKTLRVLCADLDDDTFQGKGEGCILSDGAELPDNASTCNLWHLVKVVIFLANAKLPANLNFPGGFACWFLGSNFVQVVLGCPPRPRSILGFNWLIWGGKPFISGCSSERRSHHTTTTNASFFNKGVLVSQMIAAIWELQFRWSELYDYSISGKKATGKEVLTGYTFAGKIAKINKSKIVDLEELRSKLEEIEQAGKEKEAEAINAKINELEEEISYKVKVVEAKVNTGKGKAPTKKNPPRAAKPKPAKTAATVVTDAALMPPPSVVLPDSLPTLTLTTTTTTSESSKRKRE